MSISLKETNYIILEMAEFLHLVLFLRMMPRMLHGFKLLRNFARQHATLNRYSHKSAMQTNSEKTASLQTRALIILALTSVGLLFAYNEQKKKIEIEKEKLLKNESVGIPDIGRPFTLFNCKLGKETSSETYLGKLQILYFGFTSCPDICPEELEKLSNALKLLESDNVNVSANIQPVFITCDPMRDDCPTINEYLSEFDPRFVGYRSDFGHIKKVAKDYRVYMSTPSPDEMKGDYLVDHSIFFYLMDREGKFADALGRNLSTRELADKIKSHL
eukprot:NODE_16_length_41655_cov_0.272813.p15 type:complete len:274 gc:universal NODE_16_length_41655_cov_0.272813:36848-36027(-)